MKKKIVKRVVTLVETPVDQARRGDNCLVNSTRKTNFLWYFHSNSHVCFVSFFLHYKAPPLRQPGLFQFSFQSLFKPQFYGFDQ